MSARGAISAGHPLTAEAGAKALREGGNAVDAAVSAILTSFIAESPLTGIGAGGFMLIHTPSGESHLLDFFVSSPSTVAPAASQTEFTVDFDGALQQFNGGAATCGVYGTAAGLWSALDRFGTMPMTELARPAIELSRAGVPTSEVHAFLYRILAPILMAWPEGRAVYAPDGNMPQVGELLMLPEFGEAIDRLAQDGPEPFYTGEVAQKVSDFVTANGGTISREDLANYSVIDRKPGETVYRGHRVITNPPPSSGGLLIADSLVHLEQAGAVNAGELVAAMDFANRGRDREFVEGLTRDGFWDEFLAAGASWLTDEHDAVRGGGALPESMLGSTTHISVLDEAGLAVSCTCSNGSCSGVIVPGTGISLNNMLGEMDLNPLGVENNRGGERVTSMMSPTVVLEDGAPRIVVGSAGSNRIRSAVLQTVVNVIDRGMSIDQAVQAPRVHFEDGMVQAEPGIDELALEAIQRAGTPVAQWDRKNLFFGGCQAVGRDADGELAGGGDPRRGGAFVLV
ncbi:MAG: gamma-glutamyltransferase [Thermoleophilaceae bacterium]|nr:gamma-glutamyltransferase [Thermoleophilaceae bacterium]